MFTLSVDFGEKKNYNSFAARLADSLAYTALSISFFPKEFFNVSARLPHFATQLSAISSRPTHRSEESKLTN